MPHVVVELFPGRTEDHKKQLTQKIVQALGSKSGGFIEDRIWYTEHP